MSQRWLLLQGAVCLHINSRIWKPRKFHLRLFTINFRHNTALAMTPKQLLSLFPLMLVPDNIRSAALLYTFVRTPYRDCHLSFMKTWCLSVSSFLSRPAPTMLLGRRHCASGNFLMSRHPRLVQYCPVIFEIPHKANRGGLTHQSMGGNCCCNKS